jgi:hypothetical protein
MPNARGGQQAGKPKPATIRKDRAVADTAKDFLRERIERFKQDEKNSMRLAKETMEQAASYESKAMEARKAIADFEAALAKLGRK